MVQVAMVITAIATGMKAVSWRQATTITLLVFAVTLAVQTPLVFNDGGASSAADVTIYALIQVASLAVAFAIERVALRRRRVTLPSAS